jgi:hypothetical protein
MLTDAGTPGTDDWYLMDLATEMGQNFVRLGTLRKYREGDAPVPGDATSTMRAAYSRYVTMSRLNMAELIVNAKANRQKAVGFRTAVAGDIMGDDEAWATWNRSRMAVGSRGLFADAGHYGDSFITVYGTQFPGSDGKLDEPLMVPSSPWTTWTRQNARTPWLRDAAIEVGYDPIMGVDRIILYRPGYFRVAEKITAKTTIPTNGNQWRPGNDWTWVGGAQSLGFTEDVPVVRYSTLNRKGFYEAHLDTLDRINDTIKQRTTIIAMQAFRQRAIRGDLPQVYPDGHEKAGEKIDYDELFQAGPAALWMLPAEANIWESSPTDITPILNAAKDDLKNLAAVTGTPLYTLSPDAAAGSAEGAALARETLTFNVEELNDIASDVFAEAHSLCFQAARDQARADVTRIETIFASIDRASMTDRAAAAAQAKAGGLTQSLIDEKFFGLTPAEQRQAAQDREDDAFLATGTPTEDPADPSATPAPLFGAAAKTAKANAAPADDIEE